MNRDCTIPRNAEAPLRGISNARGSGWFVRLRPLSLTGPEDKIVEAHLAEFNAASSAST